MSGKKVYIALTAGQGCLWGASISENASKEGLNPHSAGKSRDKVVFLTGRAEKGKNMFVIGGQINDSFNAVNL